MSNLRLYFCIDLYRVKLFYPSHLLHFTLNKISQRPPPSETSERKNVCLLGYIGVRIPSTVILHPHPHPTMHIVSPLGGFWGGGEPPVLI